MLRPRIPVNVGVETGLRRLMRKKLIKIMAGLYSLLMNQLYFIIKCMLNIQYNCFVD